MLKYKRSVFYYFWYSWELQEFPTRIINLQQWSWGICLWEAEKVGSGSAWLQSHRLHNIGVEECNDAKHIGYVLHTAEGSSGWAEMWPISILSQFSLCPIGYSYSQTQPNHFMLYDDNAIRPTPRVIWESHKPLNILRVFQISLCWQS